VKVVTETCGFESRLSSKTHDDEGETPLFIHSKSP